MSDSEVAELFEDSPQRRDRIERWLAAGGSPNTCDPRPLGTGNTLLHDAAVRNDLRTAAALIGRGADVDSRCDYDWTPLIRASNAGHAEMVDLLLSSGANPNAKTSEGYTARMRVPKAQGQIASRLASAEEATSDT